MTTHNVFLNLFVGIFQGTCLHIRYKAFFGYNVSINIEDKAENTQQFYRLTRIVQENGAAAAAAGGCQKIYENQFELLL